MFRRFAGPPRGTAPSLALLSLGVASLSLLTGLASAGTTPVHLAAGPWSHYDTGRVNVVYPSALPIVELVQDANASLSATLGIAGVYEVTPGGLPTPRVVAAAFPSSVTAFNGSASGGATGAPFSMFANLAVYPTEVALWAPGTAVGPSAGPFGSATLSVAFSPTPISTTAAGVALNWTVSGWPWVSSQDLLAIALSFNYASGASLTACQLSPLASPSVPACLGHGIDEGASTWGSNYASLEGEGGTGPVATVTWSRTIQFGTAASPVVMGALASNPGSSDLVLMGTNAGAGPASGSLGFSLVAPTSGPLSVVITGNTLAYALSAAGLAALAGGGVVAYRRHERAVRAQL
ncbi:MAG TPA: hypothetical protein VEY07_01960 [Thermoplasmata archaeon]|nr:hypothetical protein [Thermoplasmata archaeon]